MDKKAMYSLTYGLFLLSARDEKDNACIVNTVQQVTTSPNRVTVAVNKTNLTHDMILRTGVFNASILDRDAPFTAFQHFGFQSGRSVDKLGDYWFKRTENGLAYFPQFANAVISAKVASTVELGTHTLFIADVTDALKLSDIDSMTYARYQAEVKPAPAPTVKKGWRCRVCGYVYEGDQLPADFICPVCGHGASDFERIG